jgi:hypothetical protein
VSIVNRKNSRGRRHDMHTAHPIQWMLLVAAVGCGGEPATSTTPAPEPSATLPTATGALPAASGTPAGATPVTATPTPVTAAPGTATPVTTPVPGAVPNPGDVPGTTPVVSPVNSPVAAGGSAAPATPAAPAADDWPADCEEHYVIRVFPQGSALNSADPISIPAGQEIHPQFMFPSPWGTAQVQAVRFKPIVDNPKVLHHWILNGPALNSGGFAGASEFISGWAPGSDPGDLPADVGMYLPSGTLDLDVHYNNLTGTSVEMDKSGVEICVIQNKANFRTNTAGVIGLTGSATVPAKATNYSMPMSCTAAVTGGSAVTFLSTSPHMHKLGVHAYLSDTRAGNLMVLHDAPFDFNEQRIYDLAKFQVMSGDSLTTACTYTNPSNKTVTFGENTENEMCFNFTTYYPLGNLTCGTSL